MALVFRNGRPRMQRSVRRDGRVTSEYVASGETAVLIALLDADSREEAALDRQLFQEERDSAGTVEGALKDYFDQVEDLACAALYAGGYHRPKRQWRRRRERSHER